MRQTLMILGRGGMGEVLTPRWTQGTIEGESGLPEIILKYEDNNLVMNVHCLRKYKAELRDQLEERVWAAMPNFAWTVVVTAKTQRELNDEAEKATAAAKGKNKGRGTGNGNMKGGRFNEGWAGFKGNGRGQKGGAPGNEKGKASGGAPPPQRAEGAAGNEKGKASGEKPPQRAQGAAAAENEKGKGSGEKNGGAAENEKGTGDTNAEGRAQSGGGEGALGSGAPAQPAAPAGQVPWPTPAEHAARLAAEASGVVLEAAQQEQQQQ
jgi:hypothetical protein